MPKRAFIFAVSISVAGGLTVAAAVSLWPSPSLAVFFACLGLAVLGATFKVQLPGMIGTISPSVVPVLFAAGRLSWQETVVIATLAGIVQCVWRPKQTPVKLQVLFNGANMALSSGVAYGVSHRVAGSAPLFLYLVAAIVFYLVDTFTVATILSLLEDAPLTPIWRNCHLWSFPYILAGGGFAALWAQANVAASFSVAVLCATLLYLMSTFYREVVARAGQGS